MGTNTLEKAKYPDAIHHIKVFNNVDGKARVFYKLHARDGECSAS